MISASSSFSINLNLSPYVLIVYSTKTSMWLDVPYKHYKDV